MTSPRFRMPLVDGLKAVAAQMIVWHHLCTYGPLAEAVHSVWPSLASFFHQQGRMAVQVFLVLGGYLAAGALAKVRNWAPPEVLSYAFKRYRRLVGPYAVALGLALAAAAVTRQSELGDLVPSAPTFWQLLTHLLLLQGILDQESLTLGVWYVAMDFQLFILLLTLVAVPTYVCRSAAQGYRVTVVLTIALMVTSLWYFNRDAQWDVWAVYFWGAYGLGVCAYWVQKTRFRFEWAASMALMVGLALLVDFRGRLLLAGLTACVLTLVPVRERRSSTGGWIGPLMSWAAQRAYALFLVHFPVLLWMNQDFLTQDAATVNPSLLSEYLMGAWLGSMTLAELFYRWVERTDPMGRRLLRWLIGRRPQDQPA